MENSLQRYFSHRISNSLTHFYDTPQLQCPSLAALVSSSSSLADFGRVRQQYVPHDQSFLQVLAVYALLNAPLDVVCDHLTNNRIALQRLLAARTETVADDDDQYDFFAFYAQHYERTICRHESPDCAAIERHRQRMLVNQQTEQINFFYFDATSSTLTHETDAPFYWLLYAPQLYPHYDLNFIALHGLHDAFVIDAKTATRWLFFVRRVISSRACRCVLLVETASGISLTPSCHASNHKHDVQRFLDFQISTVASSARSHSRMLFLQNAVLAELYC